MGFQDWVPNKTEGGWIAAGSTKARTREQLHKEQWPALGEDPPKAMPSTASLPDLSMELQKEERRTGHFKSQNGFPPAHPRTERPKHGHRAPSSASSRSNSPAEGINRARHATRARSFGEAGPSGRAREQGSQAQASAAQGSRRQAPTNGAFSAALDAVSKLANNPRAVENEFRRVQWRAGSNRKTTIADRADSQALNRYYDCVPFDYNRIILHREEEMDTGYINASHLKSPDEEQPDWQYVVAQGPLFDTGAQFWEMVWMTKCPIIVMLTQHREPNDQGEMLENSAQYYPDSVGQCSPFPPIVVTLIRKKDLENGIICREFEIHHFLAESVHRVVHYQYLEWPTNSFPASTSAVRQLLKLVETMSCIPRDSPGPPIIHCNSGIGRSCAFVAMSIVLRKLAHLKPNDRAGGRDAVNMQDLLITLRKQRDSAIHTVQLLNFVYVVLTDELESLLGYGD